MRYSQFKSQEKQQPKNEKLANETPPSNVQNDFMSEKFERERIARWLKSTLKEAKISQADFAREVQKRNINLDQSKISRIISQKRSMTAAELVATIEVLKSPLPTIGTDEPLYLAADSSEESLQGFHPDLSELALEITKNLEKNEHSGKVDDDVYIEASGLLYNMLRSVGAWYPDLFETSKKMLSQVKKDRKIDELPFIDHVKSIAIYYRTLAEAEKDQTDLSSSRK